MRVESPASPAAVLREIVEAAHVPGDGITVHTDADSYRDRVLVGVRLPAAAFVMSIARSEYDGFAILKILGFRETTIAESGPDAMTRAQALKGKK